MSAKYPKGERIKREVCMYTPTTAGGHALYALDLAGSAAGAVLISAWLLPLFGFWLTALLVSVVSLASLAAVLLRAPRAPAR